MKECEDCKMLVHALAKVCRFCGFQFPISGCSSLEDAASTSRILDLEESLVRYEGLTVTYSVHQKPGMPYSIQADYYQDSKKVASDWICPLHGGYEGLRAEKWFVEYCEYFGKFSTIIDALDIAEQQAVPPDHIVVDESSKDLRIVSQGAPTRSAIEY